MWTPLGSIRGARGRRGGRGGDAYNMVIDMGQRILVVDDDETVAEVVARYLEREGLDVQTAGDGPAALALAHDSPPDLVVLDLMLPGLDGFEVCRRLREMGSVPIIMLTARGDEDDRVIGLELGADDYVAKPFSPRELVARIKAILRRAGTPRDAEARVLSTGSLQVDTRAREATRSGAPLSLTVLEFDLLSFLMTHPRQAFRREDLLERVWGFPSGDTSTVTVHIRRLREKIEPDAASPTHIRTVWGVGYRFEP